MASKQHKALIWIGALIVVLLALHLAVLIAWSWFSFPWQMILNRRARRAFEAKKERGLFMRSMYEDIVAKHGSFPEPAVVAQEVQAVIDREGNRFHREYAVARVDGKTYMIDVDGRCLDNVCLLEEDGTVWWSAPRPELAAEILYEAVKGGTIAAGGGTLPPDQ